MARALPLNYKGELQQIVPRAGMDHRQRQTDPDARCSTGTSSTTITTRRGTGAGPTCGSPGDPTDELAPYPLTEGQPVGPTPFGQVAHQ